MLLQHTSKAEVSASKLVSDLGTHGTRFAAVHSLTVNADAS